MAFENGSDWIIVVSKYTYSLWLEYVWTKEETFVTLFLLLHNAVLLAKKSNCFKFILKGDLCHQWAIVLRAGFWLSMVYCLIAYFLQGTNLQFPIFGGNRIKLLSFDQNFIDWHICKSQTYLSLFNQIEKWLLILLGKIGSSSNDCLCSSWVFKEFCISFSEKQHSVFLDCGYLISNYLYS